MKVFVINEPFVKDFCRTQRWAAKTRGRVLRAPDWLAYATAVLEREGLDARIYDFPARDWGVKEYEDLIGLEQPDSKPTRSSRHPAFLRSFIISRSAVSTLAFTEKVTFIPLRKISSQMPRAVGL